MYPEQPQGAPVPPYTAAPQPPGVDPTWSAPPVPSGPPVGGSPYAYQPAPAPQKSGSVTFFLLIALAAVLVIVSVATLAVGLSKVGDLRDEVSTLETARDEAKKQDEAAAAKLEDDFKRADLPGKLQKIKDLDKTADSKFDAWKAGTAKFGELNAATQSCDNQVDEYDRAAAPFPAEKFSAALPQKIDLENRETDCGRAFTQSI